MFFEVKKLQLRIAVKCEVWRALVENDRPVEAGLKILNWPFHNDDHCELIHTDEAAKPAT